MTLRRLMLEHRPSIAHSFANGIPALFLASIGLDTRVTATLCGGPPRRIMPILSHIIVFSQELQRNMLRLGYLEKAIHVIPGRLNLSIPAWDLDVDNYLNTLCLDTDDRPFIFMICRSDAQKERALCRFFGAARSYAEHGGKGTFIHIGHGKDKSFEDRIQCYAESINSSVGRRVLVTTTHGADAPVKFLHLADIVVGMGRSAFEGMLTGKPTLILSNEGYAGMVSPSNIDTIARHNFTSRGNCINIDDSLSDNMLAGDLLNLIKDQRQREQIGEFGMAWCRDNLDADTAAGKYEKIYIDMLANPRQTIDIPDMLRNITYENLRSLFYGTRQKFNVYGAKLRREQRNSRGFL